MKGIKWLLAAAAAGLCMVFALPFAAEDTPERLENSFRYRDGEVIEPVFDGGGAMPQYRAPASSEQHYGIDVSYHQGYIDWQAVKNSGVEFAIIRCGYGGGAEGKDDAYYWQNVQGCEENGIPYGVYLYSYAANVWDAVDEADHVLRMLEGCSPDLPVFYDLEDYKYMPYDDSALMGEIAQTFCDRIQGAGYSVGIYSSTNWWSYKLTDSRFRNDSWYRWIADYRGYCGYDGSYNAWQYDYSNRNVPGVSGMVDENYWYGTLYTNGGGGGGEGGGEGGWDVVVDEPPYDGWYHAPDGRDYWYENGVRQGTEGRGREIYDPASDAWYWLDAVDGGAKACGKDVYQESLADDSGVIGKWVRYDRDGHMVKGWSTGENGTSYFDPVYGTMCKGAAVIDGLEYYFHPGTGLMAVGPTALPDGHRAFYDPITGSRQYGYAVADGVAFEIDSFTGELVSVSEQSYWITDGNGKSYWYENGWDRQGFDPNDPTYRGKEIYDPASDAWYWLDNVQQGAKAMGKDVYQESAAGAWAENGDGTGKWVRYDDAGHMVKGWQTTASGTYYFDWIFGTMAKGTVTVEGQTHCFDPATGVMLW